MDYNYGFSFLKCQDCTAKIHCADCARELEDRLLLRGVKARVDMENKRLQACADLGGDDLLDLLEDLGVFAD